MRKVDSAIPPRRPVPRQHDRLGRLLDEMEHAHGPIDPALMDEVRRRWPAADHDARKSAE